MHEGTEQGQHSQPLAAELYSDSSVSSPWSLRTLASSMGTAKMTKGPHRPMCTPSATGETEGCRGEACAGITAVVTARGCPTHSTLGWISSGGGFGLLGSPDLQPRRILSQQHSQATARAVPHGSLTASQGETKTTSLLPGLSSGLNCCGCLYSHAGLPGLKDRPQT